MKLAILSRVKPILSRLVQQMARFKSAYFRAGQGGQGNFNIYTRMCGRARARIRDMMFLHYINLFNRELP